MFVWVSIFRRELADYFYTPIAYIFLVIFLILNCVLTFQFGNFFERQQSDLVAFFNFHPWLYLVLAPALGMRLWAEERKTGTIQTLLTLPLSTFSVVWGKFFASWVFTAFALVLTMPMWITVNYLGTPDNGVILVSYIGSFLLAGSCLAISSCMSATTQNQVVAFVLALVVNLIFMVGDQALVQDALSGWVAPVLLETLLSFSYLARFGEIVNGVVSLSNLVFLLSMPVLFIYLNVIVVDSKKNENL